MLNKVKTTVAILGMSFLASTAAQAQEFDVQKISSELMAQAAKVVEQKLQNQLENSVTVVTESLAEQPAPKEEFDVVLHTEDAPVIVAINAE
ncbi:hypothetical protein [Neptunicella sp. SCSIO 80796]|uniref:hypothetical protein n=1 Tax=Neptunicella plasticusilytica TaxID=3117012 RepID=UPI003A4DF03D